MRLVGTECHYMKAVSASLARVAAAAGCGDDVVLAASSHVTAPTTASLAPAGRHVGVDVALLQRLEIGLRAVAGICRQLLRLTAEIDLDRIRSSSFTLCN